MIYPVEAEKSFVALFLRLLRCIRLVIVVVRRPDATVCLCQRKSCVCLRPTRLHAIALQPFKARNKDMRPWVCGKLPPALPHKSDKAKWMAPGGTTKTALKVSIFFRLFSRWLLKRTLRKPTVRRGTSLGFRRSRLSCNIQWVSLPRLAHVGHKKLSYFVAFAL